MKHLWEIKHPYYCNEGNYFSGESVESEYGSWADFMEEEGDSDLDMNLVFRWDWHEADPEEKDWGNEEEELLIFWMGQRKGLYRYSRVVVKKSRKSGHGWLGAGSI